MKLSGTFNGTGAALYLCIGFMPDWVKLWNSETTDEERMVWSRNMRGAELGDGIRKDDDGTITPLTVGNGIQIYRGGDVMSAASTTYLVPTYTDRRDAGTGSTIDTWTLGSTTNRTGNWNDVCNTTYVGEGSLINIDGKWARITALTSNGEQANEVTLDEALPSGQIYALKGMYDYIGAASGVITPAGFKINDTTFNSSGELCFFEAGSYR